MNNASNLRWSCFQKVPAFADINQIKKVSYKTEMFFMSGGGWYSV